MKALPGGALLVFLAAGPALAAGGGNLTVEIDNVRNDHGFVSLDICPRDKFLREDCPYHARTAAKAGLTTLTVEGLPVGEWAVQAFHDENANREMDRAIFGIPKEGVGFSRNAPIRMSPPKWTDAVISHGAQPQTTRLALRYFMGPGSPAQWQRAHPGK